MDRSFLKRYAWLSIAAAIITLTLKSLAYYVSGSVGLLSDAVESIVNLIGGLVALVMLTIATRPADESHPYGHSKAEYFSSIIEGSLIICAAISIGVTAVNRLLFPQSLEQLGLGLLISVGASMVNLAAALVLRRAGHRHNSIALTASSQHLLTDVWTSAGVLVAIGAVALTGWELLDPLVAIAVGFNITWAGFSIVRKSVFGLMDGAVTEGVQEQLQSALTTYREQGIQFHSIRTRQASATSFISLHVVVPGSWTVHQGHQLTTALEEDLKHRIPHSVIYTHLESSDDPATWDDQDLAKK
ncbi:MAG: cation diffusion facilitator family transporter [Ignavibacteriales bacterium]|nr:cation diffusion facilitator family transporter [Ignavibacteriales bacterium]